MSRRRSKRLPVEPVPAIVESLSHDGRGVTHIDGKAVFIDGALPGEHVTFTYVARHRKFDQGRVADVLEASPDRVQPRCPHFGVCGGCSLQHMECGAQIRAKQEVLLENLHRIGGVEPEAVLEPLAGPVWGYRHKARLGVKHVLKKGRVLVGFRERHKPYVTELSRCEVLHPAVGERIHELVELIEGLSVRERLPQIEVAVGGNAAALVFRHLAPLSDSDVQSLEVFGRNHQLHIYSQPGGPDTVTPLWPDDARLTYALPEAGVEFEFGPTDFVQVNPVINRAMVARVIELLNPKPGESVLDLYCGLGNFSLPLARTGARVTGVEGDAGLIKRAWGNARANGIENIDFRLADLEKHPGNSPWATARYDRVLLDPPRSGAKALMGSIPKWGAARVVYVSCHPGSLARDAGVLVNDHDYRLLSVGVMDMFPHTAHVESIAVFDHDK